MQGGGRDRLLRRLPEGLHLLRLEVPQGRGPLGRGLAAARRAAARQASLTGTHVCFVDFCSRLALSRNFMLSLFCARAVGMRARPPPLAKASW